jgi:hypothetical protein
LSVALAGLWIVTATVGCATPGGAGQAAGPAEGPDTVKSQLEDNVAGKRARLLAASLDGTYTALAVSLSEALTNADPRLHVAVSSGSVDNLTMMALGNADLAMVQLDVLRGIGRSGLYRDPLAQVQVVAPLHLEEIHILVRKEAGITSLKDLDGRRVSVGPGASGSYFSAKALLARAGVDQDNVDMTHLPTARAVEALLADKTDAIFFTGGQPVPFLAELPASTADSVTLLDLGDDPAKGLGAQDLTYLSARIAGGTYPWAPADVRTVATPCVLIAHVDAHAGVVKSVLQAIYDRQDELTASHPKWGQVNVATARKLQRTGSESFHPGAAAYLDAP